MELATSLVGQDRNKLGWFGVIPPRSCLRTFVRVIWSVGIQDFITTISLEAVVMVAYISLDVLTLVSFRLAAVLHALRICSFNRVC